MPINFSINFFINTRFAFFVLNINYCLFSVSFPYRSRIVPVSFPYRFRIVSVSFPYRFRIVSVSFPYCFRIILLSFSYWEAESNTETIRNRTESNGIERRMNEEGTVKQGWLILLLSKFLWQWQDSNKLLWVSTCPLLMIKPLKNGLFKNIIPQKTLDL